MGIVRATALLVFALATPLSAEVPITCDLSGPAADQGLEILTQGVVWREGDDRRPIEDANTTTVDGAPEGWVTVFADDGVTRVAIITERPCQKSGSFPLTLHLVTPSDSENPLLRGCCTAAE